MAHFRVKKAFFMGANDWIVFTGRVVEGDIVGGMWMDLPRSLRGPGRVLVHSVQEVEFANNKMEMALIVEFHQIASVPLFDPSMVEGRVVSVIR